MLENCVICKSESTPCFKVNGHICNDCYSLALENSNHYWRYVKDELPDIEEDFLIWYVSLYGQRLIASYKNKRFYSREAGKEDITKWVECWMPLPKEPE